MRITELMKYDCNNRGYIKSQLMHYVQALHKYHVYVLLKTDFAKGPLGGHLLDETHFRYSNYGSLNYTFIKGFISTERDADGITEEMLAMNCLTYHCKGHTCIKQAMSNMELSPSLCTDSLILRMYKTTDEELREIEHEIEKLYFKKLLFFVKQDIDAICRNPKTADYVINNRIASFTSHKR